MLDKNGSYPTGLHKIVIACIKEQNIKTLSIVDNRKIPEAGLRELSATDNMPNPHEWQETATAAAIKHSRGGIVAPTGTGKSLVIALIASRLNVKTLVVVPTLEIKKQLAEALATFNVKSVTVENIDSAELKKQKNYDCLIIDECHHVAAKTYQKLNKTIWNNIYYRFFLTATYFRNKENEQLLFEGIAGEVIYKLTYKEAIKKGYIVPVEAYYIDLPKKGTDAYTYREVYNELVVNNDHRNNITANLLHNLSEANVSTLCLVKEIKHGKVLSLNSGMPFSSGQDEESRAYINVFNSGDLKSLIGTTGILGEGVDTKPCEYVIIAGLGKAKSAFLQQIGRAVRTYPGKESAKVILFKDSSHKFLLRHYREQCKILKEELGIAPTKLEI